MSPQTIIFYGASGAGKGTQAKLVKEYLEANDPKRPVLYLETGARLREFVKEANRTSEIVKKTLEEGGLLPSFVPIWAWTDFLIRHFSGEEHLIWDGLARRYHEAVILDDALQFYKRDQLHVVVLNVSRDWSVTRLRERGRSDDVEEKDVDERLAWYQSEVVPAINFFRENGRSIIHDINGEQTIEEVHQDILRALNFLPTT